MPVVAEKPIANIAMRTAHTNVITRASRSITASDGRRLAKLSMMSATVEFDIEFSAADSEPIAAPRMPATSSPEIPTGRPCRMNAG